MMVGKRGDVSRRAFAFANALAMLGAAALAAVIREPMWFGAGGAASLVICVLLPDRPWARSELATLANGLTGLRALLCAGLPLLALRASSPSFTALVLTLLLLDVLDGVVARRTGRATSFGEHLDREADAFLTMMLCLLLFRGSLVPGWILVAGAWRYLYAAAVALVPARGEEPRSPFARLSAALLMLCLAAGFLVGPRWAPLPAGLGTALVSCSFLRSFFWSYRRTPHRSERPG